MVQMRRILAASTLCMLVGLLASAGVRAQTISLTDLDVSQYPEISATLNLIDKNGIPVSDPQPADIVINDGGVFVPTADIEIECQTDRQAESFCAILALDRSASMNTILRDPTAGTRLDMVQFAANEFIENIDETIDWSLALIGFSSEIKLLQDFSQSKAILQNDIQALQIDTQIGTFFEPAFLQFPDGALPIMAKGCRGPGAGNKFIVFITDGGPTDNPDPDRIIDACNDQDVTVYAITIDNPIDDRIERVCKETGGIAFENVSSLEVIRKLFDFFLLREQNSVNCKITWKAPFNCDYKTNRRVAVEYNPFKPSPGAVYNYEAPHEGDPPTVTVDDEVVVCAGAPVQLLADGTAGEYLWEPSTHLDDPTRPDPTFLTNEAIDEIQYTVTVTDARGCTASDQVRVRLGRPEIDIIEEKVDICAGTGVQLNVTTSGGEVEWYPIEGIDDVRSKTPIASPASDMWYYCRLNVGGCTALDSVQVIVHGADLAIDLADEIQLCRGESVTLQANVSGAERIEWHSEGPAIFSATDVADPLLTPEVSDWIYLKIYSTNDCELNDSIYVVVNDLPTVDAGPDLAVCRDLSVQLQATGTQGEYRWTPTAGLDDPTLLQPNARPDATTEYTLTITSPEGCISSDKVTVIVNESGELDVSDNVAICLGDATQLQAEGGVGEYRWEPADGLDDRNSATPTASPEATTTYRVTHTTPQGCISSGEVVVTVNPIPDLDTGPDLETCRRSPVTLNAESSAEGAVITWTPNMWLDRADGPTVEATPDETTVYTAHVIDANGCEFSSEVVVNVIPAEDLEFGLEARGADNMLPGDKFVLNVLAKSPDLAAGDVREYRLVIEYTPKIMKPQITSIAYAAGLAGWTLSEQNIRETGQLILEGSGNTAMRDELIATIEFDVYLPDTEELIRAISYDEANSSIPSTCIAPRFSGTTVRFSPICLTVARDLFVTGVTFGMSNPSPNPAAHAVDINFSVGFDAVTTVEVFNILGERVSVLVDERLTAGEYSRSFDVSELGAGNFFVRMQSGPYVDVQRLILTR